jgi:hypothetical protein
MKQRNRKHATDGDELAEVRRIDQNQEDAATNQSNNSISFIIKFIQFIPPLHLSYRKSLYTYHTTKLIGHYLLPFV